MNRVFCRFMSSAALVLHASGTAKMVMCAAIGVSLALSSCATLDKVVSKVQSASNKMQSASNYELPASYDTAYSYRTGVIHPKMKGMAKDIEALREKSPAQYVQKVCDIINAEAKDDFEKVKMAQDHIAYLVHYDAKSFWENNVPDQSYERVIRTKLAVCEGYSNTLKKFLDTLKMKSVIVHGYARGVGVGITNEGDVKNSNHAWNIVEIDGAWYSVDCTWNSGYMDGKKSVQKYNTEWLFTKPEYFIYSHLPSTSKDQLLEKPLTAEQFKALPFMRPSYFDTAEDCDLEERLKDVKGSLSFSYKAAKGRRLDFVLKTIDGKEIKNAVMQIEKDGKTETAMQFPAAGDYDVNIFLWKKGDKIGSGCGEFLVHATEGSKIQYATLYTIEDTSLVSPLEQPLKAGTTQAFCVRTKRYKNIAVIIGRTFIQLNKDDSGDFTGEVDIPRGTKSLAIGCAASERGTYTTLASFKVQ